MNLRSIQTCIFCLCITSWQIVAAQTDVVTDQLIDSLMFNTVFKNQFTRIVTGTDVPGNFAQLDVKDAKFSGSGMMTIGSMSALSFNVGAGVSEGVAALLSDNKVSPNVSFQVTGHTRWPFTKETIVTDDDAETAIRNRMRNINSRFEAEKRNLENQFNAVVYLQGVFRDSLAVTTTKLNNIKQSIGSETNPIKKRKLQLEYGKTVALKTKIEAMCDSIDLLDQSQRERYQLQNKRNADWTKAANELQARGIRMTWLSFTYGLSNNNFYHFDSTKVPLERLTKKNFTTHQFRLSINHYKWNVVGGSWFVGLGIGIAVSDTRDDLTKTEIVDTKTYATAPNARTQTTKYTAFSGDYETDIVKGNPYVDVIYFFTNENRLGVHFRPEVELRKSFKPLTHLGAGIIFSFNEKGDKTGKARANAEVFVRLVDVNNNLEKADFKLYNNNEIGLRLVFPFNFNP